MVVLCMDLEEGTRYLQRSQKVQKPKRSVEETQHSRTKPGRGAPRRPLPKEEPTMGVKVREKIKGSGVWWVFVSHRSMRRSKKVGPRELAVKAAKIMAANLTLGRSLMGNEEKAKPAAPTLQQYYERFKKTYMETALKANTFRSYEVSFRVHILPVLGDYRLDQIDRMKMEEFVVALSKKGPSGTWGSKKKDQTLSKSSIKNALVSLGVLFRQAVRHKLILENPATELGEFYRQAPKTKVVDPLNREEVLLLLKTAIVSEPEDYPLLLGALHTGMRLGEMSGLQWPDIGWQEKFISVSRAIVRGSITSVKTKHGNRKVDCSDELLKALSDLRKHRLEEAMKTGNPNCSEWVFPTRDGKLDSWGSNKRRTLKRNLKKAGLRDIRFHDLRHTFASMLLAQGAPVTYVSNQLGHANPNITMQVYAHWIPSEDQREAVNRLPSLGVAAGRF